MKQQPAEAMKYVPSALTDKTPVNQNQDVESFSVLMQFSEHPLRLLREGGKRGLGSVGRLLGIMLLFGGINVLLFGYAAYRLLWLAYSHQNVGTFVVSICLGLLCLAYAGYRAYFGVVLDLAKFVYQNASPLFHTICGRIVDHASELMTNRSATAMDGKMMGKMVDVKNIMAEKYGKAPRVLQNSVSFILKRIPIAGMLFEMKDVLTPDGKEKATEMLHQRIDRYVEESLFSQNTISWIFWLLPVNVIVLLFLIRM